MERQVYQGSQVSGALLEQVDTCYNGPFPCTTTPSAILSRAVRVTTNGLEAETDTSYNGYGLPSKTDEYNYGSGAVGGFARETMTCYPTLGTYIHDRPSSIVTYSATGNPSDCSGTSGLAAKTTYGYDSNNNLHTETRYYTPTASVSRTINYSSQGVLQSQTDFNSHTTTYSNFTCGSGNT